ncbi:hypothetical protein VPH35_007615 [Triticum aestivum]
MYLTSPTFLWRRPYMKRRRRLEGIGRRRPGDDKVVPSSHRKPSVFFLPPLSRLAAAMERGHTLATDGGLQHRIEMSPSPALSLSRSLWMAISHHYRWSKEEHSAVLSIATDSTTQELSEWNAKYCDKFGFVFMICVSRRTAPEVHKSEATTWS